MRRIEESSGKGFQALSGGSFTLRFGPCLRMCVKGSNIKWDVLSYNQAAEELLRDLAADIKPGK